MILRTPCALFSVAMLVLCCQPAAAIVNGTVDTSHECVGSLHSSALGFHCTGTLIHESWVLTSAGCAFTVPNLLAMGADWSVSPRVYLVDHAAAHPFYDGANFDFALLHLAFPAAGEPACALATDPDDLYLGMPFTTVGFGLTSYPNGSTTIRHYAPGVVGSLNALQFSYALSVGNGGPCFGDEGGANFNAAEIAVGVVSTTDCSTFAVSGRVASVFDWIVAIVTDWSGIFLDGFETGDTLVWSATSP